MTGADQVKWTVDVWFTTTRPITVDQFCSRFVFMFTDNASAAETFACQWAASIPGVQMPTRSHIVAVEL